MEGGAKLELQTQKTQQIQQGPVTTKGTNNHLLIGAAIAAIALITIAFAEVQFEAVSLLLSFLVDYQLTTSFTLGLLTGGGIIGGIAYWITRNTDAANSTTIDKESAKSATSSPAKSATTTSKSDHDDIEMISDHHSDGGNDSDTSNASNASNSKKSSNSNGGFEIINKNKKADGKGDDKL